MINKIYKNLIIILFLVLASRSHALLLSSPTDLTLTLSPESPRAGSKFTAEVKTFVFEPVRANFRWFLNGKEIVSGRGIVKEAFTAGTLGANMTIRVVATSAEGDVFETQTVVSIGDIDFILIPLTYTPSFYKGAALPTPGSLLEIFAVPHIFKAQNRLNSNNLIYEWSIDNQPLPDKSGEGKNALAVQLADVSGSEYDVMLKVSSLDRSAILQKHISIKTYEPEILFYETNSLTGLKPAALNSFSGRAGDSFSILAEPFYFDLASLARAKFNWSAGGVAAEPNAKNPLLLELAAPANTDSQTAFNLKIEDRKTLFQQAEALINIYATK
ncbi:MAG: hypothetical protein Q8Q46_02105 [Candidatus Giovannonibacteria bacterium]|nr:hypothetical protein [Candidatus Giovannonibacteria bacterium]